MEYSKMDRAKSITGTTAVTPDAGYVFEAIQVITPLTTTAQANAVGTVNPTLTGLGAIPANAIIYGSFTSITPASGTAIGYMTKLN
jgi:hypothetical protein